MVLFSEAVCGEARCVMALKSAVQQTSVTIELSSVQNSMITYDCPYNANRGER